MFLKRVIAVVGLAAAVVAAMSPLAGGQQTAKAPALHFVDKAKEAGLKLNVTFGGVDSKTYIIETTGTGAAIFDYDNDGWPDVLVVNGTTLGASAGKAPTNHLFRNNHDGTFTDVTPKAGLAFSGWGQGVCAGDYDNDGWEDLFVTYYGHNHLLQQEGRLRRCLGIGRRRRHENALGHGLRVPRLRPRRNARPGGRKLYRLRYDQGAEAW